MTLADQNAPLTPRSVVVSVLRHAVLIAITFVMLYPLLWMVASSFKPESIIFTDLSIWPPSFDFGNYRQGWTALQESFSVFFSNSFLVAILVVIGNTVSCSITAYAFARLEFRGRRFWFVVMLGTLMLPYHVTLIPQYVLFSKLDWLNSYKPLVAPSLFGTSFMIFLLRQFFRQLPREYEEAALLDEALTDVEVAGPVVGEHLDRDR